MDCIWEKYRMPSQRLLMRRLGILGITYVSMYFVIALFIIVVPFVSKGIVYPISIIIPLFFGPFCKGLLHAFSTHHSISDWMVSLFLFFIPISYILWGTYALYLFSVMVFFVALIYSLVMVTGGA